MEYRARYVNNLGMTFLNKIIGVLENFCQDVEFFELDASNIPKADDRFPYDEETEVSDFQFFFAYKGKECMVFPYFLSGHFQFIIADAENYDDIIKKMVFSMTETNSLITQKWKILLRQLEQTFELKKPPRYHFHKWYGDQLVPRKDAQRDRAFDALALEFTEQELEQIIKDEIGLGNYYMERRIKEFGIDDVVLCEFLGGLRYLVFKKDGVFCFKDKEQACTQFKKEALLSFEEKLGKSIHKYKEKGMG